MLEHDRIEMSKRIDVNKTDGLRGCIICPYWHFLRINFKFQPEVWSLRNGVLFVLVWVVCLRGWRALVGCVLAWVAC